MKLRALLLCMFLAALATANVVVYNHASTAPVRLKVGDSFVMKLNALPGAGYGWQPTTEDRPGLSFVNLATLPAKGGSVGGAQTQVLTFQATAVGEQFVTVNYGRPWEIKAGAKPERSITVKVYVD